MDLVDRYLNAVRPLLPAAQRDDIIAELTDAIRSRFEEKESGLGRPLTLEEQEAILRDFGHPMVVAARYQPHQALIGPGVYPLYILALKWGVGITVAVSAVQGLLRAVTHPAYFSHIFNAVIGEAISDGIFAIGVITLIFAVLDRTHPHMNPFAGWKPRNLPANGYVWPGSAIGAGATAGPRPARAERERRPHVLGMHWGGKPRSPAESVFSLVFTVAAGLWVAGLVLSPETYPQAWRPQHWLDMAHITPGAVWYPVMWSLALASCAAQAVVYLLEIVRPQGVRLYAVGRLVCDAITIAGCVAAFSYGPLFIAGAGLGDTVYADGLENLDYWFRIAFAFTALGAGFDAVWNLWKLVRGR